MKRSTCVYLDDDVIRACKEQGINMSEITDKALRSVLAGQKFRDEEAYLDFLVKQRDKERKITDEMKEKVAHSETRLQKYDIRILRQKELVDVVQSSRQVASVIAAINDVIRSFNFDIEMSWTACTPLIQELVELKHTIDKPWFEKQVQRLQSGFLD